jgi:hypothetical protein
MSTDDLHRPLYVPDLLVNALSQTPERPLLQLDGGPMLTVGQVRDATSQFIQALQSLGVGRGSRVATLSGNRPEVLHVAHSTEDDQIRWPQHGRETCEKQSGGATIPKNDTAQVVIQSSLGVARLRLKLL